MRTALWLFMVLVWCCGLGVLDALKSTMTDDLVRAGVIILGIAGGFLFAEYLDHKNTQGGKK